jgi:hypothetical protein
MHTRPHIHRCCHYSYHIARADAQRDWLLVLATDAFRVATDAFNKLEDGKLLAMYRHSKLQRPKSRAQCSRATKAVSQTQYAVMRARPHCSLFVRRDYRPRGSCPPRNPPGKAGPARPLVPVLQLRLPVRHISGRRPRPLTTRPRIKPALADRRRPLSAAAMVGGTKEVFRRSRHRLRHRSRLRVGRNL